MKQTKTELLMTKKKFAKNQPSKNALSTNEFQKAENKKNKK
jgi:hypothetical protein